MTNYILDINELSRRITQHQPASLAPQTSHSSSISYLPPEILAQIFFHSISFEQFPIPSHNEPPLLLTRVSSHWRTLAINTPDLWAAFHINYKDPGEDISATNLWLDRSITKPLSISLAVDFGEQSQQGILDTLCRHSNRWKHVRFDFRHLYCPPMYSLDIAEGSIPNLTTFEFHARDISTANLSQITRLLKNAPKLRQITWVDDLADTNLLLELPLNQLTHLSLAMDHGTLDYIQILKRCSNLEHIRITRPLLSSYQSKPSPLFLNKLTSLNISYDLTAVLDYLVLPALKQVRIFTPNDGSDEYAQQSYSTRAYPHESLQSPISHSNKSQPWDSSLLISLIDRSACEISTLSLCAPMTESALLLCLSKTSASLVSLEVESVEIGDKVLSYLTHRRPQDLRRQATEEPERGEDGDEWEEEKEKEEHEDFSCPNLENLILHTQIVSSQGTLADMIASRLNPNDSEISFPSNSSDPKRTTLRKLVIVDGHWDLDKVTKFSSSSLSKGYGFRVHIIPQKPIPKGWTRNFFFRRKLCASR